MADSGTAVIVGGTALALQCAQRLVDCGFAVAAVLPLDAAFDRWSDGAGLRRAGSVEELERIARGETVDWLFSVANSLVLPSSLLECCRRGAINFHDGPLPRYAGSHATFWALLAGETDYGVTWHRMSPRVDAGEILVQVPVAIAMDDTSLSLDLKCLRAGAEGFDLLLDRLSSGGRPQESSARTFFPRKKRPRGAGFLQWDRPAEELARLVRALDFGEFFNPLCTAKIAFGDRDVHVTRLDVLPDASLHPPGTVIAVEPNRARIATATNDVWIYASAWTPRVNERLPLLNDAELTAITRAHEEISGSEPFWRERLQRLRMSSDTTRTAGERRLTEWSSSENLTRVIAAFAFAIARRSGETRVQFGFEGPAAARGLASIVPFELSIELHEPFENLCRAVEAELARLREHRTFAYDLLMRAPELRSISGNHWPISLHVNDGRFRIAFDPAQCSEDFVRSVVECIQSDDPMARYDVLRGPDADYPRDRCVHELFSEHARMRPDAPAVVFEDRVMSYGELDRRSSQLAAFLFRNGIGPGSLVGIHVSRSIEMLVILLGIMKSGAAYVPMDPIYPAQRIAAMIDDAALPMVLTEASLSRAAGDVPLAGCRHGDLAYVIYTSGSTGRPKGVRVSHRALTNLLWAMTRALDFTPAGKLLAVTTICFDIAGLELYLPLINGGIVDIASSGTAADGETLRRRIEQSRPTMMQATPATWKMLVQAGWTGEANLKILCGGEALPRDLADALTQRGREVWNLYGPTETTIWSSMSQVLPGNPITIGRPIDNTQFYFLDERLRPVPRGFPAGLFIGGDGVADGYLHRPELTSERFLTYPPNGARIYRTGDVVRVRDDDNVEYLHRADRQVKVHGYRIEPGEIEFAMRKHGAVRDAVCIVREDNPGDPRLVAYVELRAGAHLAEPDFRRHLKTILPDYAVPAAFVVLPRIPRTPNEKIDYAALPQPAVVQSRDLPNLEDHIASIWSDVLGRTIRATNHTFFEAGGNSLLLLETVRRLQDTTGCPITSTDMFANPTIRGMAAFLLGKSTPSRPPRERAAMGEALGDLRRRRVALRAGRTVSERQ